MIAMREQERIQAIEDQMEYDRLRAIQSEKDGLAFKREQYGNQRLALQNQILEKQAQLVEMEREKDYDKQLVQSIVDKINEEDEEEYRKKMSTQAAAAKMVMWYLSSEFTR